jgi:hypothetical protein
MMGNISLAVLILRLGNRRRRFVSFNSRPLYPKGKKNPSYSRLYRGWNSDFQGDHADYDIAAPQRKEIEADGSTENQEIYHGMEPEGSLLCLHEPSHYAY